MRHRTIETQEQESSIQDNKQDEAEGSASYSQMYENNNENFNEDMINFEGEQFPPQKLMNESEINFDEDGLNVQQEEKSQSNDQSQQFFNINSVKINKQKPQKYVSKLTEQNDSNLKGKQKQQNNMKAQRSFYIENEKRIIKQKVQNQYSIAKTPVSVQDKAHQNHSNTQPTKVQRNGPQLVQGTKQKNGLTDGSQYDEASRRKFVKKLFNQIKFEKPQKVKQVIKNAAHHIDVHLYVIKVWLSAYKIIFNIETTISQNKLESDIRLKRMLIQKQMISFILKNKDEKKYKIRKILSCIFQVFNIIDSPEAWLNDLKNKNNKDLKNTSLANEISKKESKAFKRQTKQQWTNYENRNFIQEKQSSSSSSDEDFNMQNGYAKKQNSMAKTSQIESLCEKNGSPHQNCLNQKILLFSVPHEDISGYQISFQKQLSFKLDQQIENKLLEVFKKHSQQFSLDFGVLKKIHHEHGNISFNKKVSSTSKKNVNEKKVQKPTQKYQKRNSNEQEKQESFVQQHFIDKFYQEGESKLVLFERLQKGLLSFLSEHSNCFVNDLQKQNEKLMTNFGFSTSLKSEVRAQWFSSFLKSNKLGINPSKRVFKMTQKSKQQQQDKTNLNNFKLNRNEYLHKN